MKKGFTLVELLATIAIIAVLAIIGMSSYNKIFSSLKERNKEQLVAKIAVAASDYYDDTELSKVTVKTLVDEGYLASENGKVEDPINGSDLSYCYYDIKTQQFVEDNCVESNIIVENSNIEFEYCQSFSTTCTDYAKYTNEWLNGSNIFIKSSYVGSGQVKDYYLTEPLRPDVKITDTPFMVSVNNNASINSNYKATYSVLVDNQNRKFTSYINLKVDRKSPEVSNVLLDETNKTYGILTADLKDDESGVSKYSVSLDTTDNLSFIDVSEELQTDNYTCSVTNNKLSCNVLTNGTYYVWVKDEAGNINSNSKNSVITTAIDGVAPVCEITNKSGNGSTDGVSFTVSCSDTGSGVKTCAGASATSKNVSGIKANKEYTVVDNVGNSSTCSVNVTSKTKNEKTGTNKKCDTCQDCSTNYKSTRNCGEGLGYETGYCDITIEYWCYSKTCSVPSGSSTYYAKCGTNNCTSRYCGISSQSKYYYYKCTTCGDPYDCKCSTSDVYSDVTRYYFND